MWRLNLARKDACSFMKCFAWIADVFYLAISILCSILKFRIFFLLKLAIKLTTKQNYRNLHDLKSKPKVPLGIQHAKMKNISIFKVDRFQHWKVIIWWLAAYLLRGRWLINHIWLWLLYERVDLLINLLLGKKSCESV